MALAYTGQKSHVSNSPYGLEPVVNQNSEGLQWSYTVKDLDIKSGSSCASGTWQREEGKDKGKESEYTRKLVATESNLSYYLLEVVHLPPLITDR